MDNNTGEQLVLQASLLQYIQDKNRRNQQIARMMHAHVNMKNKKNRQMVAVAILHRVHEQKLVDTWVCRNKKIKMRWMTVRMTTRMRTKIRMKRF